ncbi:MAG: hypothetical protein SFU83_18670 [Meiothermus sp.]|nr:hypothetical protein [Meiothermus sp.]
MNLVQRYIQAVKLELPVAVREDIGRELQSTIQDELEAFAQRNGRSPSEAEVGEHLKRMGHPVRVASTYWTRRSLVSEAAYPLYKQALLVAMSVYVTIGVLMAVAELGQAQTWGLLMFPRVLYDIAATVLFGFFAITLVFHYFGDQIAAQPYFWRWRTERLPSVESPAAYLPRPQTVSELLGNVFALTLLAVGPLGFRAYGFTLDFSPVGGVLAALLVLTLLDFGLNLLNLLQPYWTKAKLIVRLLVGLGVGFCLVQLLLIPQLVGASSTLTLNPSQLSSINLSLKFTVGICLAILVWTEGRALLRLLPLRLPRF